MDNKERFLEILRQNVHRTGVDNLAAWLSLTDFFTAPASARLHGARPGGLVQHSLNVYDRLRGIAVRELRNKMTEDTEETVAIIGLLHDICKIGCYHTETRLRKNPETGVWEDYTAYAFHDNFPLGHGEKSLYLAARLIDLTDEEALAIRWHMGAYDDAVKGGNRAMTGAMGVTQWVWWLQEADMCAAWADER